MSLGTAVPYPGLLLGRLTLAVVLQVGLAHSPGLHPVGHLLPPIVAAGESVHVLHHAAVDLQGANGASIVADG